MSRKEEGNDWGVALFVFGVLAAISIVSLSSDANSSSRSRDPVDEVDDALFQMELDDARELFEQEQRDHAIDEALREHRREDEGFSSYYGQLYDQLEDQDQADGGYSQPATCHCNENLYDCRHFNSHSVAQSCYKTCLNRVGYDVHWLDGDDDGIACEDLLR